MQVGGQNSRWYYIKAKNTSVFVYGSRAQHFLLLFLVFMCRCISLSHIVFVMYVFFAFNWVSCYAQKSMLIFLSSFCVSRSLLWNVFIFQIPNSKASFFFIILNLCLLGDHYISKLGFGSDQFNKKSQNTVIVRIKWDVFPLKLSMILQYALLKRK